MADEIEGTFGKLKAGAKAVAKKVTDPGKDLGDAQTTVSGTSDPMSPEKIASHEPTAVRRDPNQGTSGEPVSSQGTNNTDQGKQIGTSSSKSNESTPGVSATSVVKNAGKHLAHVRN